MEDVGITNGCAMVVVPNKRTRIIMAHSATEWRCAGLGGGDPASAGLVVVVVAMNQPEGPIPARLSEEVFGQVQEVAGKIIHRRTGQALGTGVVGPVNDERLSDDVVPGHETPIAAIQ